MIRHGSFAAKATLLLLPLAVTSQAVAAQDCSFGNDDMDDIQRIRTCMQRHGTTGWTDPNGFTMLHRAARYSSNSTVISVILDTGFNPNARDDSGWTPLHYAVDNDNQVVMSVLLDAGADPDVRNDNGDTPLQRAVFDAVYGEEGRYQLVVTLLEADANPNIRDASGDTPLQTAVLNAAISGEHRQLVSFLLEAGADPNLRDADGDLPLQNASLFSDWVLASMLLEAGTNPNSRDNDGEPLLHGAISSGKRQLVSALLDAGADPLARSADGHRPLHSAAYHTTDRALVAALMRGGAGAELTAAHLAVLNGDRVELATALEEVADPHAIDNYGWTPLHFAALAGRWTGEPLIVEDLITAGADPDARDFNGSAPLDLLMRYGGSASVAAVLLRAGSAASLDAGSGARGQQSGVALDSAGGMAGLTVRQVFRDCTVCPEMVVVPGGSFMMGSPATEENARGDERPQHRVRIGSSFAVGVHEVTFAEWDACALAGGCADHWPGDEGWGRGEHPVVNVSWEDAKAYVTWLLEQTGEQYRLLSEAEWEYVARAGTETAQYWAESESEECRYRNAADNDASCSDGYENTAPVGSFRVNSFGLYDVLGNVWEWTEDCWNENYSGAPTNGSPWELGDCSRRVRRGGSWVNRGSFIRSAFRVGDTPSVRAAGLGFRVARTTN